MATIEDDMIFNLLMESGGSGSGGKNKVEICRCCVGKDVPHMILKSKGVQIILPLPKTISSNVTPEWEVMTGKVGLNIPGALVNTIANAGGLEYLQSLGLQAGAGAIAETMDLKIPTMDSMGANIANYGAKDGVLHSMQVAILPAQEIKFRGVSMRQFSFAWSLCPVKKQDTIDTMKAIRMIQKNSLPTFGQGVVGYPETWTVQWGASSSNVALPRIKTAACTNFDVAYGGESGGSSVAVHDKELYGTFTYEISMTLNELTLFTRQDIDSGIYG